MLRTLVKWRTKLKYGKECRMVRDGRRATIRPIRQQTTNLDTVTIIYASQKSFESGKKRISDGHHRTKTIKGKKQITWEYKKVPRIAIAAPRALTGCTGVRKIMIEETMTEIRFIVFPMLNVKGEISSSDMYDTWL